MIDHAKSHESVSVLVFTSDGPNVVQVGGEITTLGVEVRTGQIVTTAGSWGENDSHAHPSQIETTVWKLVNGQWVAASVEVKPSRPLHVLSVSVVPTLSGMPDERPGRG